MSARAWPLVALLLVRTTLAAPPGAEHAARAASAADPYRIWRAAAAHALIARGDADSLAAAAALSFVGHPGRQKTDLTANRSAAVEIATRASDEDPSNVGIAWLRLQLCAETAGCDIRDPATAMRWVDADNGAAWLPTLALAEREKNSVEVDRILADMAQGARFDLYWNRTVVLLFDALKRAAPRLPPRYVPSDLARYDEATSVAGAEVVPPLAPLESACRESAAPERRDPCIKLARIMQRGDTVIAQLAGFSIEKHWAPLDSREAHAVANRRRVLEWRVAAAAQAEEPLLPWLRSARARWRIAEMRSLPREEDVDLSILREHKLPLEPPEDSR